MARVSVMVMIGSCKNRIMRKIHFKGKMSALDAYAWVGITSYGSPYDLYVYPELINAIFELDISYKDINRLN